MDEMIDVPISVTPVNIGAGITRDCGLCPIALAVLDACPWAAEVRITNIGGQLRLFGCDDWIYFDIPPAARMFVLDFDDGHPVEPLAFPIRLPRSLVVQEPANV